MHHLYIDLKYARLLGSRLKNFKQTRANSFAFSHTCEDFNRSKVKTRGQIYVIKNSLNFHCYHCGMSARFSTFLRQEDPTLYDEYRMEIFKSSKAGDDKLSDRMEIFKSSKAGDDKLSDRASDSIVIRDHIPTQPILQVESKISALDKDIILLNALPPGHPVLQYVESRRLPIEFYDKIGYVAKFQQFASKYDDKFKKSIGSHPRLVFPYYDSDGSIICYSCRSFGKEQPKYIKLAVDNTKEKLYGLWRIDKSKPIYVVEGQIDSLFIDNCIAVGSANYSSEFIIKNKDNIIVVPDSDYKRNPQVCQSIEKIINLGYKIALFPDSIQWKDINDMVVKGGMSKDEIKSLIDSNIMCGMQAKLELSFRKKF